MKTVAIKSTSRQGVLNEVPVERGGDQSAATISHRIRISFMRITTKIRICDSLFFHKARSLSFIFSYVSSLQNLTVRTILSALSPKFKANLERNSETLCASGCTGRKGNKLNLWYRLQETPESFLCDEYSCCTIDVYKPRLKIGKLKVQFASRTEKANLLILYGPDDQTKIIVDDLMKSEEFEVVDENAVFNPGKKLIYVANCTTLPALCEAIGGTKIKAFVVGVGLEDPRCPLIQSDQQSLLFVASVVDEMIRRMNDPNVERYTRSDFEKDPEFIVNKIKNRFDGKFCGIQSHKYDGIDYYDGLYIDTADVDMAS